MRPACGLTPATNNGVRTWRRRSVPRTTSRQHQRIVRRKPTPGAGGGRAVARLERGDRVRRQRHQRHQGTRLLDYGEIPQRPQLGCIDEQSTRRLAHVKMWDPIEGGQARVKASRFRCVCRHGAVRLVPDSRWRPGPCTASTGGSAWQHPHLPCRCGRR